MTLPTGYASQGIRSISRTFETIVRQVDGDFLRQRREMVEYRFSNGREFLARNTATRGAFGDTREWIDDGYGTAINDSDGNPLEIV
jgi:hypothetical protein